MTSRRKAPRGRSAVAAGVLVVVGLSGWLLLRHGVVGADRIVAPAPTVVADVPSPDALPSSSLTVPVRIGLGALVAEVEEHVPIEWGTSQEPVQVPERGRTDALVSMRRSAFQASIRDSIAYLSTRVEYTVRATYDLPLLPDINMACGLGEEPPPRLDVALEAPISLTSEWRLRTRSRVAGVAATSSAERDRCEVTFAGFDITGRVEDAARSYLSENTGAIDSIVYHADVRSSFERWWDVLREPIRLDEGLWLELRPLAVRRGPVRGVGRVVEISTSLEARPRVVLGDRPATWSTTLPPLGEGVGEERLDVSVEALADYAEASQRLMEALAGFSLDAAGQSIELTSLDMSGIGGGRIALEVGVTGDLRGRLFLVGTPTYDRDTGLVSVPDLDFSVETSSLLVSGASWALGARLDRVLRERATWRVDFVSGWAAEHLSSGLNRTLARGVVLSGTVESVRILGVAAMARGLVVQAAASATATLAIETGS